MRDIVSLDEVFREHMPDSPQHPFTVHALHVYLQSLLCDREIAAADPGSSGIDISKKIAAKRWLMSQPDVELLRRACLVKCGELYPALKALRPIDYLGQFFDCFDQICTDVALPVDLAKTTSLADFVDTINERYGPPLKRGDIDPPPRLSVDLPRRTATLDGTPYDVTSEQALRWIKVLSEHPGEWISSADLSRYDGELDGFRPDKVRDYIPPAITACIESATGKGSRLRFLP